MDCNSLQTPSWKCIDHQDYEFIQDVLRFADAGGDTGSGMVAPQPLGQRGTEQG